MEEDRHTTLHTVHFVPPTTTLSVIEEILVEYEGREWSPISLAKASVDDLNSEPQSVFEDMEDNSTEPVWSPSTELLMSVFPAPPPTPTSSACSESAKRAVPEMSACSMSTKRVVPEISVCPVSVRKTVCETTACTAQSFSAACTASHQPFGCSYVTSSVLRGSALG
ncbi:hypothetical protein PO909_017863 [Leuciscus waleckii]